MEDLHRLLQLLAHRRHHRREDLHHAWWSEPGPQLHGTNPSRHASDRCELPTPFWLSSPAIFMLWAPRGSDASMLTGIDPWLRSPLRSALVRPGQGYNRLERKRSWCLIHFRTRCCIPLFTEARHGSHLPRASSRRGRIRVLLKEAIGDAIQCAELLRRVWQRRSYDECRWEPSMLFPGMFYSTPRTCAGFGHAEPILWITIN